MQYRVAVQDDELGTARHRAEIGAEFAVLLVQNIAFGSLRPRFPLLDPLDEHHDVPQASRFRDDDFLPFAVAFPANVLILRYQELLRPGDVAREDNSSSQRTAITHSDGLVAFGLCRNTSFIGVASGRRVERMIRVERMMLCR